jgi:hypothetical protein
MKGKDLLKKLSTLTPEQLECPVIVNGDDGTEFVAFKLASKTVKTYDVAEDDEELLDLGMNVGDKFISVEITA